MSADGPIPWDRLAPPPLDRPLHELVADAVRRRAGTLKHLHVRVTVPDRDADLKVQLYDARPSASGPCNALCNPISVRRGFVADFVALLQEGAAAVQIPITLDGSYYAHRQERGR